MVRVLIVEDQMIMQKYFEYLILQEPEFKLVETVADAREAVKICSYSAIDLVLMDVQTFHNHDGLTAGKAIKKEHPATKVVIITSLIDPKILERAKTGCADSLWYKDHGEAELRDVIHRTLDGEHVFPDTTPDVEMNWITSGEISPRQLEMLRLYICGMFGNCKKNGLFYLRSTLEFPGNDRKSRLQLQRGSDRSSIGEQADRHHTEITKACFYQKGESTMKKLSITIGISALLLAFMPLGCLAEETQQDVPYDASASQAVFQDVLREEECQAGMAFLGYIGEENVSAQDILDYAEQTDYWYYYPFLQNAAVVDAGGCEIYVIVPASEWSVCVYPSEMTEEAKYRDDLESPYYEGAPDEVILLRCNISEIYSNVMVSVREGNMSVTYRPAVSLKDGHLAKEQRCYDFTIYSDECDDDGCDDASEHDEEAAAIQNACALLCQTDEVSYYLNFVGMSVWYDGTKEMIDGKECLVFVLGTEHEECIVRENYYAVSDNQVYYYDAINDAWNILGAG